ncbi:hypothetical protein U9M48_012023 [Paspalum notatum var. saurae]|uniref:Uncharacterized protein n=1 Tax=Paspalum notatum var. saurae TaxID=547442 RepID=A0AAQ3SX84_PASNO
MPHLRALRLLLLLPAIFAATPATASASETIGGGDGLLEDYIVYLGHLPASTDDASGLDDGGVSAAIEAAHHDMLTRVLDDTSSASSRILRSYKRSLNGFAAKLTQQEAHKLSSMDSVLSIFPSTVHELQTTRSWDFLDFPQTPQDELPLQGDVIVGMLDTGVWPDSPSFSDEGFLPPPKRWNGACHNITCNRKIIGARAYRGSAAGQSPLDDVGHGSHTASTVAGRAVGKVSFGGLAAGTARGAVPGARLAVYKVCWDGVCADDNILAAFDDAIADGVDVISLSFSNRNQRTSYLADSIAIGSFHAMRRGVVTSASAGNSGAVGGLVANVAPWLLSVAASSIDRGFVDKIVLGNGRTIVGASINTFPTLHNAALAFPADGSCDPRNLTKGSYKGKIVLCPDQNGSPSNGSGPLLAGAAGVVTVSDEPDDALTLPLPGLTVTQKEFDQIVAYFNSTSNPVGTIGRTETTADPQAPKPASFSSPGPNMITPGILKPDLSAPGVGIIASWSLLSSPSGIAKDTRRSLYKIDSGTSMACPHASGAAAYVRSFHRDWSPAMIMSALVTTATPMDTPGNSGSTALKYGAGQLNPAKAHDPGLVYDALESDYVAMLCAQGYNATQLVLVTGTNATACAAANGSAAGSPSGSDLNYPTMAARVDAGNNFTVSFPRTVTNVGATSDVVYDVKVVSTEAAAKDVAVDVSPSKLEFSAENRKISFTVTVSGVVAGKGKVHSVAVVWFNDEHEVYIVYLGHLPTPPGPLESEADAGVSVIELDHHYLLDQVLDDGSSAADRILRSYKRSLNGFAARLTGQEAHKLSGMEGVVSVFPSRTKKPLTTSKIIGARAYYQGSTAGVSPLDDEGHGSHTASTVAGRSVGNVSFGGLAAGTARGAVPGARLAIYKVCWSYGCGDADILAAFDDAIADGVDVISYSIGGINPVQYFEDVSAIGAFHAMRRGVLTSAAAGNEAPLQVSNVAPWMVSVGASTIDRRFVDTIVLGNGDTIVGTSINTFPTVLNATLAFPTNGSCDPNNMAGGSYKGKIVLCSPRHMDTPNDGSGPLSAGAAGAVFEGLKAELDTAFTLPLPGLAVDLDQFGEILAYVNNSSNPVGTIDTTETRVDPQAPVAASFSSPGPNLITPGILKPDLSAPGIDIIASWSPLASPSDVPEDKRKVLYNIISGTSMACPHVSGAAAYIKSFHRDWSPAMIMSALITTATPMNTAGNSGDTALKYGAGQLNPAKAKNPGLVYDASESDYVAMLCAQGYNATQLALVTGSSTTTCSGDPGAGSPSGSDLNYPTMAASVQAGKNFTVVFPRTVTNVGAASDVVYDVKVLPVEAAAAKDLAVDVSPSKLEFSTQNQKISFTVTVSGVVAGKGKVHTVAVVWYNDEHEVYIVYMGHLPTPPDPLESEAAAGVSAIELAHHHMLDQVLDDGSSAVDRILRSYKRSLNGFAAKLTEQEAHKLYGMEGVVSVFPSRTKKFLTTRSWDFLGFPQTPPEELPLQGEVIIGMIDTGIWPDSPSFSDEGFGPPPSRWKGICQNFTCNNKIIGARAYNQGSSAGVSPLDHDGHGSHTASTVAGRSVGNVSFGGLAAGTARGAVPGARLAVYKVGAGADEDPSDADILAAFDDAIADGVDVISYSIGDFFPAQYFEDVAAIGAFHAMRRGVLTSAAAGNEAPFQGSCDPNNMAGGSFKGKIVLCSQRYITTANNSSRPFLGPFSAGAAGVVFEEVKALLNEALILPLPGLAVDPDQLGEILAYVNNNSNPVGTIDSTETRVDPQAPVAAYFSSPGPNLITPGILKPDLSAPGIDIIASWSPQASPSDLPDDKRKVLYNIMSGTSMACPHVSGAAAYIKSFHRDWSPAMIMSALITTATPMDTPGNSGITALKYGAGQLNPAKARDPGLVYDASESDYVAMLCAQGYNATQLALVTGSNATACAAANGSAAGSPSDLNYPTMAARVDAGKNFTVSFPRTVTNVGDGRVVVYDVKVVLPADAGNGLAVEVAPSRLEFGWQKQKMSFNVTVSGVAPVDGQVHSAAVVWYNGEHEVRRPVVVYADTHQRTLHFV